MLEAHVMTSNVALKVAIGLDSATPAGFVNAGWGADAHVAVCPTDGLPWADREAESIACGPPVPELPTTTLVRLLHDCRRVLRPRGTLAIVVAAEDGVAELRRLAGLVGLEEASTAFSAWPAMGPESRSVAFTKPERRVTGAPSVSILIPAYNPGFFAACLDSALAQTYANAEIVVCDDSSDGAIESMVRARGDGRRVRYVRNAERLGVRANYRRCFEVADGEFIKFLCDDDLLAPDCVARLVEAFRTIPDLTLATSHRQRIDANGRRLPDQPATVPIVDADTVIAGWTLANAMLMAGLNVVGEPTTALFRKSELLDQAPGYFRFNGTEGHGIIDMVTWTALLLRGDAVYVRESLSSFRIHPGQRQHDPAKARRNVESIRELQYAWLALGLFERIPRTELLTQPYPAKAHGSWQRRTVGTMPTAATFVEAQWTIAPGATGRWGI